MAHVIYRKSDGLICALVHPRRTPEAENKQLSAEIQNVVNSELKGVATDYSHLPLERMPNAGEILSISESGTVSYQLNPEVTRRAELRQSARAKLSKLGLTVDELSALIGT
jgi:hypothetical protein